MLMHTAPRATAPLPTTTGTPIRSGLLDTLQVETARGWCPAGSLQRGDRLHSFDGGLRTIVAVDRAWILPGDGALLSVPRPLFNGSCDMTLLPGQHILIDTWDDPDLADAVVALIPAAAMRGLGGAVWQAIDRPVEVITPVFEDEEVIYANGGMLLHCPGVATGPGAAPDDSFFTCLDLAAARALLARRYPPTDAAAAVSVGPRDLALAA